MAHHRLTHEARSILLDRRFAALELIEPPDPFNIVDPCPCQAEGIHHPITSCGETVCCHCSKVFWS